MGVFHIFSIFEDYGLWISRHPMNPTVYEIHQNVSIEFSRQKCNVTKWGILEDFQTTVERGYVETKDAMT